MSKHSQERLAKMGTVALIIKISPESPPVLIDKLSDEREIAILEAALVSGENNPLEIIYEMRDRQAKEDEEFGNYVEELLSQPFVRSEIQEHGVQWLKSKIRIEQYQRAEAEAASTIAQYAFELFVKSPHQTDFILAGPQAKVRIRVFSVEAVQQIQSGAA